MAERKSIECPHCPMTVAIGRLIRPLDARAVSERVRIRIILEKCFVISPKDVPIYLSLHPSIHPSNEKPHG